MLPSMQATCARSMHACLHCTSWPCVYRPTRLGPAVLIWCRRIRCGWAQHKQATNSLDYTTVHTANPHNCNVYVGNMSPDVSDADLRHHFGPFGDITDVKIYRKGPFQLLCMYAVSAPHARHTQLMLVAPNIMHCSNQSALYMTASLLTKFHMHVPR